MNETRTHGESEEAAGVYETGPAAGPAADGDTGGGGSADPESQRIRHLVEFLRELVQEEGKTEAAGLLGVNYRTLVRAEESGELTGRMRDALERLLLAREDPYSQDADGALVELAERVERLEDEVQKVRQSLEEVQVVVRRQESSPDGAAGKTSRGGEQWTGEMAPGDPVGASSRVAGQGHSKPVVEWRRDPEVVTEEPEGDDACVYGAAWTLVEEWRSLRSGHPNQGRTLSWLTTEERLLTLELAMLEDHGLTLPPEKQPLRGFGRRGQITWRRTALGDTRRALRRRRRLRWLRRVLTLGMWRK